MYHGQINQATAKGLKELRSRLAKENIPPRMIDGNVVVATWNIREFGKKPRRQESIHYIAEILHRFDITAVTELRADLGDLKRVMDVLGPYWRVVFSDFNPDRGGNRERMAFLYDRRTVNFTGLAAEADSPRKKNKKTGEYETEFDWWRSPYVGSFKAGSFDFVLIAAHIRWGKNEGERKAPLRLLAKWLKKRQDDPDTVDEDIILLGDFNIPVVGDDLYKAITSQGLKMPAGLVGEHGSNLAKNKRYDQILHAPKETKAFTGRGGVVDFFGSNAGIKELYVTNTPTKRKFTYEMSDHLPLWVEVSTDILDEKLDQIIG